MTYGILIVAHGSLAGSLRSAVEHVLGDVPGLGAIGLGANESLRDAQKRIREAAASLDRGRGVAVVTDMHGGSPCNLSQQALCDSGGKSVLLTGANLPMLVALARSRDLPLAEAADAAVETGRKYVQRKEVGSRA